jgi:hypothetical protein
MVGMGSKGVLGREVGPRTQAESVSCHDLVAPRVLHGPDALNGDAEAPGESHIPVRTATRHVNATGVVLGDLPRYGVVIGRERNARFDTTRDILRRVTKKKRHRKEVLTFWCASQYEILHVDGTSPKPICSYK